MASEGPRKGSISVERMAVRLFKESWENKPKYLCLHIERGEKKVVVQKVPNNTDNDSSGTVLNVLIKY